MAPDLYDKQIVTLARKTEYMGPMLNYDCQATTRNRLCGDQVTIELRLENKKIKDIRYQVRGCILCEAASEHLASLVHEYDLEDIKDLRLLFENALTSTEVTNFNLLPSHQVFRPARSYRNRHSCLLLPYDALIKTLSSV